MGKIADMYAKLGKLGEAELEAAKAAASAEAEEAEEQEEESEEEEEEEEEEAAPPPKAKKGAAKKPAVDMKKVQAALVALSQDKGKKAVVDVLSRFGVTKLGDLAEENFAECLELAQNYEDPEEEEEEEEPTPPPKKRRRS